MSGGNPYQGFALSYREGLFKIQGNSRTTAERMVEWGKTSGSIVFNRNNNILYYDNNFLINYSNIVGSFTAPLSFGANIDNNGKPRRYCKADLDDMNVKLQYTYTELLNITLPIPTKTGYEFDGWYTEESGGIKITNPTVELLGNKTIYSHWTANTYKITFNANGGSGNMSAQQFSYGTRANLSANTFIPKRGYEFKNWNTKANGSGISFEDEAQIINIGTTTLYAQWELATLVTQNNGDYNAKFLNGPITKNQIESLTFTNSIASANSTKYDVSTRQDGSILCWYVDSDGDNLYEVTIGTTKDKVIANPDSSNLLSYIGYNENSDDTTCIYGIEYLDTSIVTNMKFMFRNCGYQAMTDLDLGDSFDTSKVTNMNGMFWHCGCRGMNTLNLGSKFDTSNVTDMYWMFQHYDQTGIKVLNLGDKFDTSNVINMDRMFNNLEVTTLDLGSKFNTSKCEYMNSMFSGCFNLTSLDLGNNFDTSNVSNMQSIFNGCNQLQTLELGDKFNTSNVSNMSGMFLNCRKLENIDLGDRFNTSNVTNMESMFYNCENIVNLDLGDKFDTSSVQNMNNMFRSCGKKFLTNLDLGDKFDTSNVIDMHEMFYFCGYELLQSLDLGDKFNTSSVTNMDAMFYNCGKQEMTSLDIRAMSFDENTLTTFNDIFAGCGKSGDCTVYVNQDYETFVINNKSLSWSSIVSVVVN